MDVSIYPPRIRTLLEKHRSQLTTMVINDTEHLIFIDSARIDGYYSAALARNCWRKLFEAELMKIEGIGETKTQTLIGGHRYASRYASNIIFPNWVDTYYMIVNDPQALLARRAPANQERLMKLFFVAGMGKRVGAATRSVPAVKLFTKADIRNLRAWIADW